MSTMWTIDTERMLLSYIKDQPSLWQPKNPDYYKRDSRQKKNEELILLLKSSFPDVMNTVTIDEIKRKMKNLRTYFNREMKKVIKKKTGRGADQVYKSKWPLYNDCLFFKDIDMDKSHDSLGLSEADDFLLAESEEATTRTVESPRIIESEGEGMENSEVEAILESHPTQSFCTAPQVHTSASMNTSVLSTSNPPSKKRKRRTEEEARLEILETISQSLVAGPRGKRDEDPIDLFCASLSEPLRSLPLLKREKAKLEIQKIIVHLLEEDGQL